MNNFDFLKKTDKNLYEIISEAEKLYRDEYFEQCMVQTRKFGENICKNVIGTRCTPDSTFDEMLATLKDKIKSEQEKEFIDDLYFLLLHLSSEKSCRRLNQLLFHFSHFRLIIHFQ